MKEKEERLIMEFGSIPDWEGRYQHLIGLGKRLPPLSEQEKSDENLVRGCQSRVWLLAELEGDRVQYRVDSDSTITKGLAALVAGFYSGEQPSAILSHSPEFLRKIGLDQHLSPTRANGLMAMVKQIKIYAMAYQAKLAAQSPG